jgi:Protein of unknown function (DUF3617)
MKRGCRSTVLFTLAFTCTALAQPKSPMRAGNWEVTMKMSMQGMNMEMPPTKSVQCVTAEMISNPQAAIPQGPGGSDCKVNDYKFDGRTATYTMTCTKPTPTTAAGEMTYTGTDAYTGTLRMDVQGQKMAISYDAKRLGDCPVPK